MPEPLVLVETQERISVVTLNRPQALNALSTGLRGAISDTFNRLRNDPETEVIILTGAGRAFTVGLDLKELGGEIPPDAQHASTDLAAALAAMPQPVIGAVNGFAITGGFELALMCDFLIASTEARFADTHGRVGVVPGWGLSQRLPRLIGANRAKELSLTGNYLDAPTAYAWGLVNRVVAPEALLPTCLQLARDILSTEPVTRGEIKRLIDAGWNSTLAEGLRLEDEASKAHSRREVRPEKVAARRAAIQDRGRDQSRK
ncbi:MAG: enoyl-CoA hydratase [Pseudomonadales bacterium]|nr:enoyl-CoA hydratase [Pseudomonadales bacterium]MCP5182920.1 enoyl-CoA hydratase [Pseudomonadales bacterium]